MNSTAQKIESSIDNIGRGSIFFADDFVNMGTAENIRQILLRCAKSDKIVRIAKGIYCYPTIDDRLGLGVLMPSYDEIANAIAERAHARIVPTGDYALNVLGLSKQVPANVVFFTDGSSRKVSVGKGNGILFKHTSEMRTFAYRSKLMLLIVMALREIGDENITELQMNIIKGHLKNVPTGDFQKDILLAPAWVRKKLQQV